MLPDCDVPLARARAPERPRPAVTFAYLRDLLELYPLSAYDIGTAVSALQTRYPNYPCSQINYPDGPWPREKPYFVVHSHLSNDASMAVHNLRLAGRTLNETEEKYLHLLLQHWCGWSATSVAHHNDSWIKYIQHHFRQYEGHTLFPVLDTISLPEEVDLFPPGLAPSSPTFLLLADSTSYYFYIFDTDELLRAGSSLEEVYNGLREAKHFIQGENKWMVMPHSGIEYDYPCYFPQWGSNGNRRERQWRLYDPIEEFVPRSLIEDDSDTDEE